MLPTRRSTWRRRRSPSARCSAGYIWTGSVRPMDSGGTQRVVSKPSSRGTSPPSGDFSEAGERSSGSERRRRRRRRRRSVAEWGWFVPLCCCTTCISEVQRSSSSSDWRDLPSPLVMQRLLDEEDEKWRIIEEKRAASEAAWEGALCGCGDVAMWGCRLCVRAGLGGTLRPGRRGITLLPSNTLNLRLHSHSHIPLCSYMYSLVLAFSADAGKKGQKGRKGRR